MRAVLLSAGRALSGPSAILSGPALPRLTTPALRPVASATWRELIKRVWEVDPLLCPRCGTEMVKLAAIQDPVVIMRSKNGAPPVGVLKQFLVWFAVIKPSILRKCCGE